LAQTYCFLLLLTPPPTSTPFPYTTLFRSKDIGRHRIVTSKHRELATCILNLLKVYGSIAGRSLFQNRIRVINHGNSLTSDCYPGRDRKSTRLNSSHVSISYAVFCLKKKMTK